MLVRVTRNPLRVYAKWLPDGAHAGQKFSTTKPRVPTKCTDIWRISECHGDVDVARRLARALAIAAFGARSRYRIHHTAIPGRRQKFAEAGVTRANAIEVKTIDGARVVAFTYETPSWTARFLRQERNSRPGPEAALFPDGGILRQRRQDFESIVFQNIAPKTFDDARVQPEEPCLQFLGKCRIVFRAGSCVAFGGLSFA